MSTALVTGGSRGIGREICAAFARAGYDVAFTYAKDEAGARETVRRIQEAGAGALAFRCDVSDAAAVHPLFGQGRGEHRQRRLRVGRDGRLVRGRLFRL